MALDSQLLKFKSSGVKQILEIGDPQPTTTVPTGARLLLVNSKKGRVNYPIPVQDYIDYIGKFDAISDADERRGNFGARIAQQMLQQSPIYVLNLRQFDDTVDTAGVVELSSTVDSLNNAAMKKPYKKLFNTQQFWKIDSEALLNATNTNKLLVFGNIGVQALSIFVRKSRINQFNQTFETWYSSLGRDMPSYVNKSDKVKDWMVDVFVFANQFSNSSAANSSYGYCFDSTGKVRKTVVNSSNITVDGLTQLSTIPESGLINSFTGSLVQGFTDETGNNLDIIDIINSYVERTGLIAYRNEAIYDDAGAWISQDYVTNDGQKQPISVDFKGHNFCHVSDENAFDRDALALITEVKELSYNYPVQLYVYPEATEKIDDIKTESVVPRNKAVVTHQIFLTGSLIAGSTPLKVTHGPLNKFIVMGKGFKPSVGDGYAGYDGNLATVKSVNVINKFASLTNANTEKLAIQPFNDDVAFPKSRSWFAADGVASTFKYTDSGKVFPKNGSSSYYVYPVGHPLAGLPVAFEKMINGVATNVVHNPDASSRNFVLPSNVGMTMDQYVALIIEKNPNAQPTKQVVEYSDIDLKRVRAAANAEQLLLGLTGKLNDEYVYEVTLDKNLLLSDEDGHAYALGDLPADDCKWVDDSGNVMYYYNNTTLRCYKVNSSDDCTLSYAPVNLSSYIPRNKQFLDGTRERQSEVLSVLNEISLDNGLQNQDLIDWMYLVDGFKSYVEPNIKYQLKDVCKKRITARAIYNMPFFKDFSRSTNPYFSSSIGGDMEMKYVAEGGNFELPYSNQFSTPIVDGYFAYGFSSLEAVGGKIVPSSGLVSNLFARKHQIGKPYMILAGNPEGVLDSTGIAGPEHVFIERNDGTGDRDYLEPAGWNLILRKQGVLQIYSNKTSYTTVNSPVSSIHTSEVVMFLQLRIKSLLDNFVFKYNTANNRLRIVEQANAICDEPKGEGAISGYINQMDDKNNTQEVIANRIGILDTTIFANNGMEILVHRTRIDIDTNTATFEILQQQN